MRTGTFLTLTFLLLTFLAAIMSEGIQYRHARQVRRQRAVIQTHTKERTPKDSAARPVVDSTHIYRRVYQ